MTGEEMATFATRNEVHSVFGVDTERDGDCFSFTTPQGVHIEVCVLWNGVRYGIYGTMNGDPVVAKTVTQLQEAHDDFVSAHGNTAT